MPCGGSEEQPNKAMNVLCRPRVQSQVRHVLCVARIDAYCQRMTIKWEKALVLGRNDPYW